MRDVEELLAMLADVASASAIRGGDAVLYSGEPNAAIFLPSSVPPAAAPPRVTAPPRFNAWQFPIILAGFIIYYRLGWRDIFSRAHVELRAHEHSYRLSAHLLPRRAQIE